MSDIERIGEAIDGLIVNCNNAVGAMTRGEYIRWCSIMVLMVQELSSLKDDVSSVLEAKEKTISGLKALSKGDANDA